MKTEQIDARNSIDRIVKTLRRKGFGKIPEKALRKIVVIVRNELILDAVFTPLEDNKSTT
jgi:hypothetical protein